MKRLCLVASLIGLFMYSGFTIQAASLAGGSEAPTALRTAVEGAGATLRSVTVSGWVEVQRPEEARMAEAKLGSSGQPGSSEERREVKRTRHDGVEYLAIRTVLTGSAASAWRSRFTEFEQVLALAGKTPALTVEMQGRAAATDPVAAVTKGLKAVAVHDPRPWIGLRAASGAGQSDRLPPGLTGINIQVAARLEQGGEGTVFWAAWPALQQEY